MPRRPVLLLLAMLTLGCGESSPTDPGPAADTRVVIVSATVAHNATLGADEVTLRLRNAGGAGSYVLELWALPDAPGGQPRVATGASVTVTASYDETVTASAPGLTSVQAVKVRSRSVNSAAAVQTDCRAVRTGASYCP